MQLTGLGLCVAPHTVRRDSASERAVTTGDLQGVNQATLKLKESTGSFKWVIFSDDPVCRLELRRVQL